MKLRQRLILSVFTTGLMTIAFALGMLVGARHYFPYPQMVAFKDTLLGSSSLLDEDNHNRVDSRYLQTDPAQLIELSSAAELDTKRSRLHAFLWSDGSLPLSFLPKVERGIQDKRCLNLQNLERVDRLTVNMDFGINSVCYHFVPKQDSGQLVIYHQGHRGDFFLGEATINELLGRGYSVIAMSMPLEGMNSRPTVDLSRFGQLEISKHDHMKFLTSPQGHPLRFFFEPVVAIINYVSEEQQDIVGMVGFSGGGWVSLLMAAIDTRIPRSYAVAASLPIYLRSGESGHWGDYEQTVPEFYTIANYLELYVLASVGNAASPRRHVQFLNRYDLRCFYGLGYTTYETQVAEAVNRFGHGSFSVILDETHREHKLSDWTLKHIVQDLATALP